MNDLMFLEIQDFSREQIKSIFNRVDSHGIVEQKRSLVPVQAAILHYLIEG